MSVGVNWLTAFFETNRILVVQSYPGYIFVDVELGAVIGHANMEPAVELRMITPQLMALGSELWTVNEAVKPAERAIDLGVAGQQYWKSTEEGHKLEWRDSSLRIGGDGRVVFDNFELPSWLHCGFGERIADWRVCGGRLTGLKGH